MATETAENVVRAVDWEQVYLDALAIDSEAPGTVCTAQVHYVRDHRHPIPYRTGIVHNYRQENEHWHPGQDEARQCPDDWMKRLSHGE
jgi:hypothetical protein